MFRPQALIAATALALISQTGLAMAKDLSIPFNHPIISCRIECNDARYQFRVCYSMLTGHMVTGSIVVPPRKCDASERFVGK